MILLVMSFYFIFFVILSFHKLIICRNIYIFLFFIFSVISFYFIFFAFVTLQVLFIWNNISYLLQPPAFVLTLFFLIPCVIAALTSFRTIIVTNFILLIFVVVFGFFVAFTNMQFKDYVLLRPFLEHGIEPVMKAIVFKCS